MNQPVSYSVQPTFGNRTADWIIKMSARFSCSICFGFLLFQQKITYRYTRRTLWSPCKQLPPPFTTLLQSWQYTASSILSQSYKMCDKFKVWLLIISFISSFFCKHRFLCGNLLSHINSLHVTKQKLCRRLFRDGKKVKGKVNFKPVRAIKL